jgi:uncharacterized protein YdeI (YjbR/CyaY-like superfamily)
MQIASFQDIAEWEAWLARHHASRSGIWLRIAKKTSGLRSVTVTEALEVAVCYGWIDNQRKSYDASYFLQRYSPRRPGSSWSRANVERVEALMVAGRMRPSGLAEVDAAKADGRWDAAYEAQRTATVPDDLAAVLAQDEQARAFFETLGRTNRYAIILPLLKAQTPAGRETQLRRIIARLRAG